MSSHGRSTRSKEEIEAGNRENLLKAQKTGHVSDSPAKGYAENPGFRQLLEDVGKQIRELRLSFGFTQKEMHRSYQFGTEMLGRWEMGKSHGLTLWALWRFADALGYDVKVSFVSRRRKHVRTRPKKEEQ